MKAIQDFNTFTKVTKQYAVGLSKEEVAGGRIFGTRYVLTTKKDGTKKARLVVQAYDYNRAEIAEVYSPVTSQESFMLLLHLTAKFGWGIQQLDAKNAYLHAKIPDGLKVIVRSPDKKEY